MPKRAKTPPPPEDEPKFLTVVFPYPSYADMDKVPEQRSFSRWIACCIGDSEMLVAIYHKPASPTILIIEVLRSFQDWGRLLGLHRWSEFLRLPTEEEKEHESKIFYCTLSHGREVQKHGWKRVDVLGSWFKGWNINNDPRIKFPYPPTSYCDMPPVHDKTNKPLWRPLPVADFPRPPAPARPDAGTSQWITVRAEATNIARTPAAPAATGPLNRSATSPAGSATRPAANAWSRGPPGIVSPPALSLSPPLSTPSPSTGSASDFPLTPPGITSGWHTNTSDDNGIGPLNQRYAGLDINDSDEDDEWAVPAGQVLHVQEIDTIEEEPVETNEWETNEWADYDEDAPQAPPDAATICPFHGPGRHCKKGICREWKAADAKRRRQERDEQRRLEREQERGNGAAKKKSASSNDHKFNMVYRSRAPAVKTPLPQLASVTTTSPSSAAINSASPTAEDPIQSTSPSNPIPPPANRPARGRRQNAAGAKPSTTSPVDASPTTSGRGGQPSSGGWDVVSSTPWDSKSSAGAPKSGRGAKNVPPPAPNGGWGKAPGRGQRGKKPARGAPSVVGSNNGGWGEPSQSGNWNSNPPKQSNKTAPTTDDLQLGEDASTWTNKQPGKSWAEEVDDELGSQLGDRKGPKSVAGSSASGWTHPASLN